MLALTLSFLLAAGAPLPPGTKQGELLLRRIAECDLNIDRPRIETYLTTLPGSPEQERLFALMEDRLRYCRKFDEGSYHLASQALRGALAGAIYRHDFPHDPDFAKAGNAVLPAEWWRLVNDRSINRPNANNDAERRLILLQDFANCLVDTDPANASALVRSEAMSDQEAQAFSALVPKIGPCLPNGVTFTLAPTYLRAFVAESLLRKARTIPAAANDNHSIKTAVTR